MFSLPNISIKNPVFAWMLMSGLIIFGGISFTRMGISQMPDVDFPVITVNASLEGAAPEVIENTVIEVLEGQLTSVEGMKSMTSTSKTGSASISLEFDISRNIDLALQDVQSKVAQAQRRLPKDMDPPSISKTNPEDQPILWIAATSETMSRRELSVYVRDQIRDQFTTLPGVGEITLGGYVDPSMRIWVEPKKLSTYQLTVSDILNTLVQEHSELPAGKLSEGDTEWNLRAIGEAKTPAEFGAISINQRGGSPNFTRLQLRQVADIEAGLNDIRRQSRVDGISSIGLGIRKQRGSNAVAVADGVLKKLEQVQKQLPDSIKMKIVVDNTAFVREAVHELNFALIIAAILTSLLCWLFLGSLASTFNILMSIPTSIVGSFIILYFSNFTLNTFTLLGLSLAIGIVVDDAIMVLENIIRHREMGKSAKQAALDGSNEIMTAAIAATFSIAAIFLPVAFMEGVIGKFFYQFGVTMTAAVFLSLVEAITLTPMRAAALGGKGTGEFGFMSKFMHWMTDSYRRLLKTALNHRAAVLVSSVLIFIASLGLLKVLNKEFTPAEDQSRFMVRILAPVGSNLEYTDARTKEAEAIIKKYPEVTTVFAAIGGFGGGDVNSAVAFVTLTPRTERKRGQIEIMNALRKDLSQLKGARAMLQELSMRAFGSGRGYAVEFTIQGPDWETLEKSTDLITNKMEKDPLFADVDTDLQKGAPEIQIIPDREQAALRGVSVQQIGETVNALIGGVIAGYYSENGHRYEIRVKVRDENQKPDQVLASLTIRNNRGELIPLRQVVKIERQKTLQQITRRDRTRSISIYSNVATGQSQEAALQRAESITREVLPKGYTFRTAGSSQGFRESMQSLFIALMLGIVVAYMILGSQFNSFLDPVTILLAMPFSITGALAALWISKQSVNLYSMIGVILLMGIVKKNSILLVEFTNHVKAEGITNAKEALLKACPTRLRPIVMTSVATIAASIPAAIAFGPGSESRAPMAIAVIGGVLVSTVLTLFVVPCFYSVLATKRRGWTE